MRLCISVLNGSLNGQSYRLHEGVLLLGRGVDAGVRFDPSIDGMVSSRHCLLQAEPDGFYVVDNQSTNGTYVNGQRIQRVRLNHGDVIELGAPGVQLRVALESPAPTMAAAPSRPVSVPGGRTAMLRQTLGGIGMYDPERKPPVAESAVSPVGVYVGTAVGVLVCLALTLLVALIMLSELGIVVALIATIVAFVPAFFYMLPLLWLDRYDPEPVWALAASFVWGGVVAVIVSYILNSLFGAVAASVGGEVAGTVVGAVISAPIVEEGSKGLGLLLILLFLRREFDDIVDGIVYGGFIALGFATVENILYYGRSLLQGGFEGLLVVFILRGILSPFAHVTFTAMTGIGCGLSRESHNLAVRLLAPLGGYILAVILHMIWNGMAVLLGGGFLIGYALFEVPFFLLFIGFLFYVARREGKILREMLSVEVARGLITPEQLAIVTSAIRRTLWPLQGNFAARRAFLRNVSKLGLSYWHVQRAVAAQSETRSLPQIPRLQAEIMRLREQV
ncbi:MAG: PrsW family glutamic-type intramembrane protease [Chloracidobacterium sp.]|uniref:PrsW family intramembrane metalloprotease n=1 Tax=Chloracidobacterium validum TaxID=2821543 RepID=A0ABX8B4K6_9BACT|nr:PrsW family glutamic-type intramembrane protease [Chloracidobacterium validum]QUW01901.1 PrsW family intramembrane metalloprotease [Chloracidobacterium validum]